MRTFTRIGVFAESGDSAWGSVNLTKQDMSMIRTALDKPNSLRTNSRVKRRKISILISFMPLLLAEVNMMGVPLKQWE